jgi:hypothetical protein
MREIEEYELALIWRSVIVWILSIPKDPRVKGLALKVVILRGGAQWEVIGCTLLKD